MNRSISLVLILLLATTGTLFAKKKKLPELRQIIPMAELTPEMVEDLIQGATPELAIECQPGTELAPKFSLHYGIISALFNPAISLKVDKPFYLRLDRKKAYVSNDLINWDKPERWLQMNQCITKVKLGENMTDVLIEMTFVNENGE